MAARWAHNPKVVGSNPTPATLAVSHLGGLAGAPSQEKNGGVAQTAEQTAHNR